MSISLAPVNQNPAQSTKFQLNFSRLPYVTFFCMSANIPGVSLQPVSQPTLFIELFSPADKITYEDLSVKFLVDEEYRSWQSVHDWIRDMTFPKEFQEYINLPLQNRYPNVPKPKPQFSDAILSVYTNRNNPHIHVQFIDCFPTSLSSITFDTENDADHIIYAEATFKFAYYDIKRLK
jgi:hypothetical protein